MSERWQTPSPSGPWCPQLLILDKNLIWPNRGSHVCSDMSVTDVMADNPRKRTWPPTGRDTSAAAGLELKRQPTVCLKMLWRRVIGASSDQHSSTEQDQCCPNGPIPPSMSAGQELCEWFIPDNHFNLSSDLWLSCVMGRQGHSWAHTHVLPEVTSESLPHWPIRLDFL